jgi:hypothetical protein
MSSGCLSIRKDGDEMAKMGRPKSENPKIRRINVRIEEDLFEMFDKECEKINVEKSTLIRSWIIEFLENKKEAEQ